VSDLRHSGDNRFLERQLPVCAVGDQIEAVGYGSWLEGLAVPRRECRTKFAFVRIRGLVQVDVDEDALAQRGDEAHQCGRFFGRTVLAEGTVRIDGVWVPSVNALVAPRTHARGDEEIDLIGIAFGVPFQKFERPVNAAGLVAVNAARDQYERLVVPPIQIADREQPVSIRGIVQLPVFRHGEPRGQAVDSCDDVARVATLPNLSRKPLGALGIAPCKTGCADGVRRACVGHVDLQCCGPSGAASISVTSRYRSIGSSLNCAATVSRNARIRVGM
jgi:hypothetical protein